jgi:hypothetical protein
MRTVFHPLQVGTQGNSRFTHALTKVPATAAEVRTNKLTHVV